VRRPRKYEGTKGCNTGVRGNRPVGGPEGRLPLEKRQVPKDQSIFLVLENNANANAMKRRLGKRLRHEIGHCNFFS